MSLDFFLERLANIPIGFSFGLFEGRKYKIIHEIAAKGRREKLYAEDLEGHDHISFNLYRLSSGRLLLKPCEMPEAKVVDFVAAVKILKEAP